MFPPGPSQKVSPNIVFPYFFSGVLALVASSVFLFFSSRDLIGGNFLDPKILALVHLAALGWITSVMTGAFHQMAPVLLNAPLFSQSLSRVSLPVYLCGWIGMVSAFATSEYRILPIFASLAAFGLLLLVLNLLGTVVRASNLTLIGFYILSAILHLTLALGIGVLLAFQLVHPFLPVDQLTLLRAHVYAAFAGWIGMTVMGVSLRLIPMFSLSHGFSTRPGWIALILTNVGLIGTVVSQFAGYGGVASLCTIVLIAGLVSYLVQVLLIIRSRVRKLPDPALTGSLISYLYWMPLIVCMILHHTGLVTFSWNAGRGGIAFFFFLFFGPVSSLIISQLLKIVPFLVWLHHYGPMAGRLPTPLPRDLLKETWVTAQLALYHTSVGIGVSGILLGSERVLQAAGLGLLASSLILLFLCASAYSHMYIENERKGGDHEQGGSAPTPVICSGS
ncbi:MAG: hypothetical protein HYU64_11005 [Armatimonadetes bacterium]|nr:hypothetical protein [Armatimonadota bacterium]